MKFVFRIAALLAALSCSLAVADDWPEWRGLGRLGIWNETGILERFPDEGLRFTWRVPVAAGYSGPAVAGGRAFVTDATTREGRLVTERAICVDEQTGEILWTHSWDADYAQLDYPNGPRATPTIDGNRVYILGAVGHLFCLNTATGAVLWKREFVQDFSTSIPTWGTVGAPLVDGDRLICLAGGEPDGLVIALDKTTGAELWRALPTKGEPGYVAPTMVEFGGMRQLIVWHPRAVASLDPSNGETYWEQHFPVRMSTPIASPVFDRGQLFVSAFFSGPLMLQLNENQPSVELLWKGTSESEVSSDGLHACLTTPVLKDGYIYGICAFGELRCLDARTGERLWETQAATVERARYATAFIVQNGDRYLINNDRGELILGRLAPSGYEEISRTKLIKPTTRGPGRREMGAVSWTHPAYANGHIVIRNDEELVRASLLDSE